MSVHFADPGIEVSDSLPRSTNPTVASLADVVGKTRPKPLGEFEHTALDQVRHGIQLNGCGLTSQTQRLERDRTTAREEVQDTRRRAAASGEDFCASVADRYVRGAPLA
jgi:hypothetical protein